MSHNDLIREFGIRGSLIKEKMRTLPLDFLTMFQTFVDIKKAAHIPKAEWLNYTPRCRVRGVNYRKLEDFIRQFGLTYASLKDYRLHRKEEGDLFDLLKQMQNRKNKAFLINGKVITYNKATYQKRKQAVPTETPVFPSLVGFDFDTECYDILSLYRSLVKKAKEQAG